VFFEAVFVELSAVDASGFDGFDGLDGFGVRFDEPKPGFAGSVDTGVGFTVAADTFVVAAEIFPGGFFVIRRC
jgi:hypothetical protein